jgi:Domain of unknown function (DUF1707)/Cell wall-active antibiotics response 4TMS YvqF
MNEPEIRVSDSERDRVVELLSEHASVGRLTLAELEDRTEQALAARTRSELDVLTRDLPTELAPPPNRRKITRWFVAVMGGSDHRGRQRLSGTVNAVAVMGGDNIDLRDAEIDGDEVTINVFSLMGGSDFYVPDTVDVELSGFALMGGDEQKGSTRAPRPGAPIVRIRSYAVMGGCTIWRLPAETRGLSLKEARRAAKRVERGGHNDHGHGELHR